ncbi:cob(I)yrinic acid a,c-diamide adenosyltransferase [uncultured Fusobacterium sp.]|uniref:cob(I)yrinic acid a,c-diamide adenosyltransferase n=1 Tax=uncultured Fusobacterium sp. TaxID=159267 RepID=UPI0025D77442|nr:cob(I)yrinic acid a,c-diamide adenosyltransferase [uncultured Fusobacterium sp.]
MKDVYTNLMKVYTRKGDSGETGLFGGSRIAKDSIKVEAYGSIDEAAAFIGEARAIIKDEKVKNILHKIQEKFLVIGAHLASDSNGINKLKESIEESDIVELEKIIDEYSKTLLPLYKFIISGDNRESATLHVARTVVRRSERRIVTLKERENIDPKLLKYVNRVSDVLFVLSRVVEDDATVKSISEAIINTLNSNEKKLNLESAKKIVEAGEKKAKELGLDFVLTVVNKEGHLILEEKMDNAIFASIDIAFKKAYTAAALKIDTVNLTELTKPTGSLYGLQNDSRYIIFGGGFLLRVNGEIVGAIGVSGGTVEQDMEVAKACVEAFDKM